MRRCALHMCVRALTHGASTPLRQVGVLIVGAGPTGLGVATRLHQRKHADWALLDQARSTCRRRGITHHARRTSALIICAPRRRQLRRAAWRARTARRRGFCSIWAGTSSFRTTSTLTSCWMLRCARPSVVYGPFFVRKRLHFAAGPLRSSSLRRGVPCLRGAAAARAWRAWCVRKPARSLSHPLYLARLHAAGGHRADALEQPGARVVRAAEGSLGGVPVPEQRGSARKGRPSGVPQGSRCGDCAPRHGRQAARGLRRVDPAHAGAFLVPRRLGAAGTPQKHGGLALPLTADAPF